MSIAYFAHELADAAVRKRMRMLSAAGHGVTLLGFARDRGDGPKAAEGAHVLGVTQNARLFARIFTLLAAIPRALRLKAHWADADLIIARNLEMLVLAVALTRIASSRARIAYECLDIHRLALSHGPIGAMVRAAERACLKRTAMVVTSSPAFERHYFRETQRYANVVLLAENKVLDARASVGSPQPSSPWVIAWCGVLRCQRSFDLLRGLAASMNGRVRIELWGAPALDQIPDFHEAVLAAPHLTYRGRYTAEDLPRIYAGAHFAWAIDFYEAGGNSQWLLPNRLYESLCFSVPPIAAADTETARWLERHEVGVVLPAPIEQHLAAFFGALTADQWIALRARADALDPELTRLTPDACRAFAQRLLGVPA